MFDVDAIGLVNVVHNLNSWAGYREELDWGVDWVYDFGGGESGVQDMEQEVRRFAYKVEAGAEYAITQPVFDLRRAGGVSEAD